jgi:hypothetical protein
MTDPADAALVVVMAAAGWVAGLLFTPGPGWSFVGLVLGLAAGWLMAWSGVRRAVGPSIAIGGIVGAWIGREIVRALCLPGSCPRVELAGATVAGLGSLLGIGLVVALVVRSFEEFAEGRRPDPPPGPDQNH